MLRDLGEAIIESARELGHEVKLVEEASGNGFLLQGDSRGVLVGLAQVAHDTDNIYEVIEALRKIIVFPQTPVGAVIVFPEVVLGEDDEDNPGRMTFGGN